MLIMIADILWFCNPQWCWCCSWFIL